MKFVRQPALVQVVFVSKVQGRGEVPITMQDMDMIRKCYDDYIRVGTSEKLLLTGCGKLLSTVFVAC